jgi:hypothetical protein
MEMVWLLTPAFLATLGMGIAFLHVYGEQKARYQELETQYRKLYDHYELYRQTHVATPTPPESTKKDDDAQAVQGYQGLAKHYRAMIDELYDFGEQIVQRYK